MTTIYIDYRKTEYLASRFWSQFAPSILCLLLTVWAHRDRLKSWEVNTILKKYFFFLSTVFQVVIHKIRNVAAKIRRQISYQKYINIADQRVITQGPWSYFRHDFYLFMKYPLSTHAHVCRAHASRITHVQFILMDDIDTMSDVMTGVLPLKRCLPCKTVTSSYRGLIGHYG